MSHSLTTHGSISECSRTNSLTAPIGKGREGKGDRKGEEVGHLAYPSYAGRDLRVGAFSDDRRSAVMR